MRLKETASASLLALCLSLPLIGVLLWHIYGGSIGERISHLVVLFDAYGPSAWIALAMLQTLVAISGVLPASALGIAAGAVYGIPLGFGLTAVGTMVGAGIAFAMARTALRPFIQRKLAHKPYLARIDRAVDAKGWRTVCLLRCSPIMPFAIGSYVLGMTSITFWRYWLGSLATLPALFGYVVLGAIAKQGLGAVASGDLNPLKLSLMVLGVASTGWFIMHIGKIAKEVLSIDDSECIAEGLNSE
ncbi:hypothetical protein C9I57_10740 [Trinickia symbiotica]|uniref:TVP38/TMEM64 family membrane protein n=1 Tax=Trinickia symbiotica TaxID=863227 RepID=A0A2T3XXD3_9BURK|nr:VTT domain-containing protein [Trinickia symbiotica]PTB21166.1 hypothetical protein C9I57_10740 [Trinickia symbiotica]